MTDTATRTNEQVALASLELISRGDTGPAIEELVAPDAVYQRAPRGGPDGFREVVRTLNGAFADISITPQDVICGGDKVVARTRFQGLHVGPFQGVAPTGRTVEIDQIHIWRLQDGRIVQHWACMDEVAGLRQMGLALPPSR